MSVRAGAWLLAAQLTGAPSIAQDSPPSSEPAQASVGLNGYLRSNPRMTFNRVHGHIQGEGSLDVVQARLQLDL